MQKLRIHRELVYRYMHFLICFLIHRLSVQYFIYLVSTGFEPLKDTLPPNRFMWNVTSAFISTLTSVGRPSFTDAYLTITKQTRPCSALGSRGVINHWAFIVHLHGVVALAEILYIWYYLPIYIWLWPVIWHPMYLCNVSFVTLCSRWFGVMALLWIIMWPFISGSTLGWGTDHNEVGVFFRKAQKWTTVFCTNLHDMTSKQ